MNSPSAQPRSLAAKASWTSLGLALGCAGIFLIFQAVDQLSPFDRTRQGVLTGFLPRTALYTLWAGETLSPIVGIASFLLIRRQDIASRAIYGIVARSMSGIAAGLFGTIVLWLVVGHIVVGF